MKILILLAWILWALPGFSTTVYVSQSGGSVSCGADGTQSTTAVASVTWTGGNTYNLCGTFTGSAGATMITVGSSGSAGNVILIQYENNASLTAPYWNASNGAINLGSHSYITIDGKGTTSSIVATDNGSALTYQQATRGINTSGGNVEIKNMTIANLYVHSSSSDTTIDPTQVQCIDFLGSNVLIHDNVFHDAGWCLFNNYADGDGTVSIYNNTIYDVEHGWMLATQHSGGSSGPFSFYGNTVYGYSNWDVTTGDFHHDGVHCFTSGTSGAPAHITSLSIYNNTFKGPVGVSITAHIFIEGGTGGGATPCADTSSAIYIYNNLGILDQPSNNGVFGIFSGSPQVYNNTMVGSSTSSGVVYASNSIIGTEVFDNNVLTTGNSLIAITGSISFSPDYNIYANGGGNSFVCGSNFYNSSQFASWKSCISGDSHSSYSASAALNSNGTLQSGSPAIGAAVNLNGLGITPLDTDACGVARPGSAAWDAGFCQYVSGYPTPGGGGVPVPWQ